MTNVRRRGMGGTATQQQWHRMTTWTSLILLTILLTMFTASIDAFEMTSPWSLLKTRTLTTTSNRNSDPTVLLEAQRDDEQGEWDDDIDYDALEAQSSGTKSSIPDPFTDWNEEKEEGKLGIDIGSQLEPMTPEDAAQLKAEAAEIIKDTFDDQIDEIEMMRKDMAKQVEKSKIAMQAASEYNAVLESEKLLGKIDKMTGAFLDTTKDSRESTKLAAAADRAMQRSGQGVEMGTWGVLGGAVVATDENFGGPTTLLGSVDAAREKNANAAVVQTEGFEEKEVNAEVQPPTESRILIVADESSDPIAKQVLPKLTDLLEEAVPGVIVQTIKPTAIMPMGGDNAQCLIVFGTSLSDRSGLNTILSRVLRRTLLAGGKMGAPPTQLVCISTVGTERFDKFPYSMQNLMGGGKFEKRRQIEELLITNVKNRVMQPPLDYTIIKLGEVKEDKGGNSGEFQMMPGDVLDGTITSDAAAQVVLQAIAYQPAARNATLCATGGFPASSEWDDIFLRLDGPELLRFENLSGPKDQLVEYIKEWGGMLPDNKKLTTPIGAALSNHQPNPYEKVVERAGVRLLFLPTNTGTSYLSKDEERAREARSSTDDASRTTGKGGGAINMNRMKKEGGVEVLVEVTADGELRVRARRCNMGPTTVVKEISEKTILKRVQAALDVWIRDHPSD